MPTAKNWYHILVSHLEKHVILKKSPFHLDVLLLDLYQKLNQNFAHNIYHSDRYATKD